MGALLHEIGHNIANTDLKDIEPDGTPFKYTKSVLESNIHDWDRGHALYNHCFEDIKKAFNGSYTIVQVGSNVELRNTDYTIVLGLWLK